jgi:hypothetical protein
VSDSTRLTLPCGWCNKFDGVRIELHADPDTIITGTRFTVPCRTCHGYTTVVRTEQDGQVGWQFDRVAASSHAG